MFAVQNRNNGQYICSFPTRQKAQELVDSMSDRGNITPLEIVPTSTTKLEVNYVEIGGPWGYGCNTPEFTTYGGVTRCVIHLINWLKESARVFGPDYREVIDYINHCRLYINGKDYTKWLQKYAETVRKNKPIFV